MPSRLLLGLILLLALVVRLYGSDYALWYDEIASVHFAAEPLRHLWSDWMVNETNPPLYCTLLKLWIGMAGDGDRTIRLLSTLIGLVGIVCAWECGRALAGPRAAAAAGLLLALSQQHVFYSQMVRGYVLGSSATLLVLVGLIRLAAARDPVAHRARVRALALYAVGAMLAVYSHTTLVLVPLLANIWAALWFGRDWQGERRVPAALGSWILANLAVLVAWSWWARLTWLQAAQAGSNIGWIQRPSLPYAVRMTLESYAPWGMGQVGLLAAALFAGLFGWGIWRARGQEANRGLDAVIVFAAGAPVLLFALSQLRPVFLPRTVYFASGPFLVGVAVGLATLPRRLFGYALTIALVLEGWAYAAWFPVREIEPWRAVAAALSAPGVPATLVVQGVGPAFALQRYCPRTGCGRELLVLPSPQVDHWSDGMVRPAMASPVELSRRLACGEPLDLLRWAGDDPARALPAGLARPEAGRSWGPASSLGLTRLTPLSGHREGCPAPRPGLVTSSARGVR